MGVGSSAMNRAVFLDRDGVINRAVVRDGKPYPPDSVAKTEILPDVPKALALLKEKGLRLAVITNQPDVARGAQTKQNVEAINAFLADRLPLDCFEVCFHDDSEHCDCRKPKPGLIHLAAQALDADPGSGFVVGDRWRDIEAGRAAGCRTVWIDRGYAEQLPQNFDFRAQSLWEAAQWIVQQI